MIEDKSRPSGRVVIEARRPDRDGRLTVVARRESHNTVVRSGAELVAALFMGTLSTPVNGMGVGINPEPIGAPYELTTLTTVDSAGQPLVGAVAAAIPPDSVIVETLDSELRVRISIRGVLREGSAGASDGGPVHIGEAALGVLSADGSTLTSIYNRVTFEPIPKRREHELSFYWEISFPYGS